MSILKTQAEDKLVIKKNTEDKGRRDNVKRIYLTVNKKLFLRVCFLKKKRINLVGSGKLKRCLTI